MKRMRELLGAVMLSASVSSVVFAESATAVIHATAEGSTGSGTAAFTDTPQGLHVVIRVGGVPAGKHAIHIHQYGDCGDRAAAAGGHFNPDNAPHGFLPHDGLAKAHPGDMGNIDVGADDAGALTLTLPGVTLSGGAYSVGGRAIVLHEHVDDFGQPTGNAGGRIGCGPIVLTKE